MKNFVLISFTMILISLRKLLVARETASIVLTLKDKKKRKVIIEIIGKNIATINRLDGIQDSMQEFVDLS